MVRKSKKQYTKAINNMDLSIYKNKKLRHGKDVFIVEEIKLINSAFIILCKNPSKKRVFTKKEFITILHNYLKKFKKKIYV